MDAVLDGVHVGDGRDRERDDEVVGAAVVDLDGAVVEVAVAVGVVDRDGEVVEQVVGRVELERGGLPGVSHHVAQGEFAMDLPEPPMTYRFC